MSAFGMTYAMYVAVVGGSLLAFDPPVQPDSSKPVGPAWAVSVGANDPQKSPVGQDGFLSVDYRPNTEWIGRFKPQWGLGASVDGAVYANLALRKDYRWGAVQVTPYIGPALYQSQADQGLRARELIQFRTGFDVLLHAGPKVSMGLGYYHISNAKLTRFSAGIDVTRFTLQFQH